MGVESGVVVLSSLWSGHKHSISLDLADIESIMDDIKGLDDAALKQMVPE